MYRVKKQIAIIVFFFLCFIGSSSCGVKDVFNANEKGGVVISCIPLYIDRTLYSGDAPVCYLNGKLMIPQKAFDTADREIKTSASSDYESLDEFESVFIPYLNEYYCYYDEIAACDKYDCFFYDMNDEKQVSIRRGKAKFDYSWIEGRTIAHAFGGIDGYTYTNSLEAFLLNYENGHTVFEVDMEPNEEGDLLCIHEYRNFDEYFSGQSINGKEPSQYTKEEFLSLKVYGKYTSMTIDQVIDLLYEYPDIYIVTDTKETEPDVERAEFQAIIDAANKAGKQDVLKRIIPQIYNTEMYYVIMDVYEWNSMIFTTYLMYPYYEQEIFEFAYDNGIKVLTMWGERGTPYFIDMCDKYGILTYTHTHNTEEERESMYDAGFYGVYTDFLLPDYSK